MDFLIENENEIIRNIHEPEEFVADSFEAITMGVGITLIAGVPQNPHLIQALMNPNKLVVQGVKFSKPDWTIEAALDWLKQNQKHFEAEVNKRNYAKELNRINGVEIFSAGTWNGDEYSVEDLDLIIQAFEENKSFLKPFLKLGHSEDQKLLEAEGLPAAGWVERIYRVGEKIVADFVDIPRKIYELIENKAYRKVSCEIYWDIDVNDKQYKYLLGAVALLGAETPGVMNLNDILAMYGLKNYNTIKTYANDKNKLTLKSYSFANEEKDEVKNMEKSELEKQLELQVQELQAKLEAAVSETKSFQTEAQKLSEEKAELEKQKADLEKAKYEAEAEKQKIELEKQVDSLINDEQMPKSARQFAILLLGQEPETKKYSLEINKETKELSKFDLLKEISKIYAQTSDVNFDDNSLDVNGKDKKVSTDEVQKYAEENKVTYAQAYKALFAGKLKSDSEIVEE